MNHAVQRCKEFCSGRVDDTWNWFNNLSREEWMVVLAIVAVAGFAFIMSFNGRR